jgi:hypothetical protein
MFQQLFSCKIADNKMKLKQKKEPQKGPLSLTNYRTKIFKDFDLIKA